MRVRVEVTADDIKKGPTKHRCSRCHKLGHRSPSCLEVHVATRREIEREGLVRCWSCGGLPFLGEAHVCPEAGIEVVAASRPGVGA